MVQDTPAGVAAVAGPGSTCLSLQNELLHYFIFILLETFIFLKPWNYFPESYKTPWGCCGLSFPDEVFSWPNPLNTQIQNTVQQSRS